MLQTRKQTRPVDKALVLMMGLMMLFGLITLFSATFYRNVQTGDALRELKEQLFGALVGLIGMNITMRIPYSFWQKKQVIYSAVGGSLVLLILVAIPGIGRSVNGSRRWIGIGGFSFQPGELAKYASVLLTATILTHRGKKLQQFFKGVLPVLMVPGIMFLLILEQPNLSTAGTIIIVTMLMLLIAGVKWKHMAALGAMGGVVGFYYAWSAEYRRERLLSFLNPFAQMSDEGYQLSQSLIAFGSGGVFGRGLGQGRQKFAYLPYPESDFIFAIVGEDFGLLGCLAVIMLFVAFLLAGMRIALRCEDKHGCLLAAGIVCMICTQAFINMGVVVGILPTTGLPLPFFSAGGTSLSITMAAVGIVLNVSRSENSHVM